MLEQDGGFEKVSQGINSYFQENQQQASKASRYEELIVTAKTLNATDTARRKRSEIALGQLIGLENRQRS